MINELSGQEQSDAYPAGNVDGGSVAVKIFDHLAVNGREAASRPGHAFILPGWPRSWAIWDVVGFLARGSLSSSSPYMWLGFGECPSIRAGIRGGRRGCFLVAGGLFFLLPRPGGIGRSRAGATLWPGGGGGGGGVGGAAGRALFDRTEPDIPGTRFW